MTVQATIADFLRDNRGVALCDDCIAERLGLKRRQQAQAVTSALAETDEFLRSSGNCSSCSQTKNVIHAK